MWQYILIAASAVLLFGFVSAGVRKFGLLDCYSAYGPKWGEVFPPLNVWSVVTFLTAALMIPVLLEQAKGNPLQFLGFLAPVSLGCVAASPNYQTDKFARCLHQIGACGAVVFIVSYIFILHMPWLFYVVGALVLCALVLSAVSGWDKWMFWAEMAVYLMTYVILCIVVAMFPG